jgi:histidinol phosphatase-like enzyme (inositol monophosphatase family)
MKRPPRSLCSLPREDAADWSTRPFPPDPASNDAFAAFALQAARDAGAAILPHFRAPIAVEDKGGARGYDPVTEADRAAEASIRNAILARYPEHGIEGEEHGTRAGTSRYTWVIDPIDGTRSFILGHLHWATLLALNDGERPIVGVTHQPYVDESFVAFDGRAEWLRRDERRELRVRRCPRIDDAIVATTDPRHFVTAQQRSAYDAATARARLVRFGGDCYCYTQLAMGLVDVVIETGLNAYDIQALIPLIENAGGVVTDWQGGRCDRGGDVLACGDAALHAQLLRAIASR